MLQSSNKPVDQKLDVAKLFEDISLLSILTEGSLLVLLI